MAELRPMAVVTGASSGIGAAYARRLAEKGYNLALVARRRDRLEALAQELRKRFNVSAEAIIADLTKEADLKAVSDFITEARALEFLVNNAGFGLLGRFFASPPEGHDSMHRLHIIATLRLSHAALVRMTERGKGALVNVSSVAAFIPRPGNTSYYATKAWINCFTEGIYLELQSVGSPVRVQALCPGFTLTEFHDVMGVDRKLVPGWLWMSVEDVVAASLKGLEFNQLFVVPGWHYKSFVFLLRLMPRSLRHALALKGTWKNEASQTAAGARNGKPA
ncbi:MAG TPA: SDR family oxidoreductase [Terriglobia bacterium]|jgi:short-subunit dehydrogenase|nr:SDR family oxidoreductase [Terriglobia bacterium]